MKTVHISDFRGAQDALRNGDLTQALYDEGGVVMDDTLINLNGTAHRRRRVTELAVFGREFFRHYERRVFPEALRETLARYLVGARADLVEFGYLVTMNLTADFAGIDRPARSLSETQQLLHLVRCFSEGATLVHSTRDHEEVRAEVLDALAEFDEAFLAPSRRRRMAIIEAVEAGRCSEDELPRDVITTLLRNRDRMPLADEVFRREVAFYLQAGSHSTANALTHAMHEIFAWCDTRVGERGRLESDIDRLQRCVHESLRLHPASPVAWRRAVRPTQLSVCGDLETGDRVVIDLQAANRDPEIFGSDAGLFNPDRRLAGSTWPFGLTFGYGAHACIGRDLDGGVVPRDDVPVERRQLGIVTLLADALLKHGACRDPHSPPRSDAHTQRRNWSSYPIVLARREGGPGKD